MRTIFSVFFIAVLIFTANTYSQDQLGIQFDNPLTAERSPVFNNQTSDAISTYTWWPASTYPNTPTPTYFQASAWLNDTLYVQDPGATGLGAATIIRYTLGGTWTTGVPIPSAKVGGSLTTCNGRLYYIGGGVGTITAGSTDVYQYNPSTGAWLTMAPLPLALSGHSAANWGDSVIFVVGGPYTGAGTNLAVQYYRVGSNTWGTIANSIPSGQGRRTFALGIEGNKLFMAGGFNTVFLINFYIGTIGSDASTITWAAGPNIPTPAVITGLSRPGGWAGFGKFYVICGERGGPGGYSDSVRVWDIGTSAWTNIISGKPVPGSNIFNACVGRKINDTVKVFVPGVFNVAASPSFDVLQANYVASTGIIQTSEIATTYILSQNYPNPFNPGTKISFAIPRSGDVKITVSDVTGKTVSVLLNEFKNAGAYTLDFNAANLSSGVYFYTISSIDFKETKRMLLVK